MGNIDLNTEKSPSLQQPMPKKKITPLLLILSIVVILLVVALVTTFFMLNQEDDTLNTSSGQKEEINNNDEGHTNISPLLIKSSISGYPGPCQPESFDPKTDKYTLKESEGTPSKLYEIDGFNGGEMMIDGWYEQGEDKIDLPSPYSTTVYTFGCASSTSYVIELNKNNVRQSLFTHVYDYSFSEDGKYLYVQYSEKDGDQWIINSSIVDIQKNQEIGISNLACGNSGSMWQSDRLLTYSVNEELDYTTQLCIWDTNATLLSNIDLTTAVGGGSGYSLIEKIGLLPNDPDILYAYTTREGNTCSLFLINIFDNDSLNYIDIYEQQENDYYCAFPNVEFDLTDTSIDNGNVRYRIEEYNSDGESLGYGEWMQKSI
jgi:hypothetical protein